MRTSSPTLDRLPDRSLTPLVLTVLLMLGIGGCASTGGAGTDGAEGAFATVVIENDNPRIVNVTALRGGTRFRLGTVSALSTEELEIERHMIDSTGQLQLLIQPLGSGNVYRGQPILVSEGDIIELTVSSMIR